MTKVTLFRTALICNFLSCWIFNGTAADFTLPEGSAPEALVAPHFPDRVHEFVWRNWNVVEPAKMAAILDTSMENVDAVAKSMGLPPAASIPPEMKTRGFITIIRRNWHLLPYDQLLQLLEMTPRQLAVALREDDFLWIKLGSLKPKCKPLRYTKPDESTRRRAAEIKRLVEEEFDEALRLPAEPRFHFVEQLSTPVAGSSECESTQEEANQQLSLRFIYSYFAVFGDPLLNPELDPYPDGLLQRLSALDVNGVWLHVVLRDLAPGGTTFPEFGEGHQKRLANLRALVERAKKYGIGVYLYMNEPRAMPKAFFEVDGRKGMAGVSEGNFTAICTSNPKVRDWMRDALTHVFSEVPDLGGVFTITASENLTNCASHGRWKSCPRCKNRSDADIIAEVNATIAEGVHRGNPQAKVIAYDWGWRCHGDAPDIIARLPKSIWLMSVSEWALPINRGGVRTSVGEYSMSAVGPGPRATRHWKLAKAAGLKTVAKVQLNNTWEISSVPYLPVMDLVAEHCHNLASANVDGMMLSWSLGGYPSPNLEIAARFRGQPTPSANVVLDAVATEYYGEGGQLARKAWSAFSTAFREFPYGCSIYATPAQMGPANPLYLEKTGYMPSMVGIPYDNVQQWRGAYPAEVFADRFTKIAKGWKSGIPYLKAAVAKAPPNRRAEVQAELRYAQAALIHFQSVANQTRFILARDTLAQPSNDRPTEQRRSLLAQMHRCLQSEIELSRQLFMLASGDSKIGFEASNHYYYLPLDLVEKVINCRWIANALYKKHSL